MDLDQVELANVELYRSAQRWAPASDTFGVVGSERASESEGVDAARRKVAFILGNTLLSGALRSVDLMRPMLGSDDHDIVFVRSHEVSSLEIYASQISLAVVEGTESTNVLGTVACLRCIDDAIPIMIVVADAGTLSEPVAHLVRTGAVKAVVSASMEAELWSGVLRLVLNGGTYLPGPCSHLAGNAPTAQPIPSEPVPATRASEPTMPADPDGPTDEILTAREREILALLSEGHQNKIIASDLALSEHTVKVHLQNLYRKLGVHNRTQAVAVGRRLRSPEAVG